MRKWQTALNAANLEKTKLKPKVLDKIEVLEASEQMVTDLNAELEGITDPTRREKQQKLIDENVKSIDELDTEIANDIAKYAKALANMADMLKKKAAKKNGGSAPPPAPAPVTPSAEELEQKRLQDEETERLRLQAIADEEAETERLRLEEEGKQKESGGSNILGWFLLGAGILVGSAALAMAAKKVLKK